MFRESSKTSGKLIGAGRYLIDALTSEVDLDEETGKATNRELIRESKSVPTFHCESCAMRAEISESCSLCENGKATSTRRSVSRARHPRPLAQIRGFDCRNYCRGYLPPQRTCPPGPFWT